MADGKYFDANGTTSQTRKIVLTKQSLATANASGTVLNQRAQLQAIKNIAELWLQADLDNRTTQMVKLEIDIAEVLHSLDQESAKPISEIFQKLRDCIKHNAIPSRA